MKPVISIIVAVRDGAATLEKCIDSIANQSFVERELIVKDGGSTDGTLDILNRRSNEIAYWTSGPDKGIYDAWNRVLDRCRGDWLCFLGCDDELAEPHALASLVARAQQTDAPELVTARAAVIDADGRTRRVIGRPLVWKELCRAQLIAHPGALHRADLFRRVGRFDDSFAIAGDYEFLMRLGPHTRAAFVDRVAVKMGGNGVSNRRALRALREGWTVQARHPEVGRALAAYNFGVAVAKLALRRALAYRR